MRTETSRSKAFSLVEMVVVISIMALLMGVLLPVLNKARSSAKRIKCGSNLKQISIAMRLYTQDHDGLYPAAEDPLSVSPAYWLWMGRGFRGFVEPYLGGRTRGSRDTVLYCPGDEKAPTNYDYTSYAYSMSFYHSPEQIDAMDDISDTYGSSSVPPRAQGVANVARPSRKILCGEWLSNHYPVDNDDGWWCRQGKRNFLFADGHIEWLHAEQINQANDGNPNPSLTRGGIGGVDIGG